MTPEAAHQAMTFIDSWLDFHARNDTIPGFVVAVQHKNKHIFHKAYGLADIANETALNKKHLYNAGSQAKMYTAVAIMQLAEQGALSLDDPVAQYVPWLGNHRDSSFRYINIRQLLWHGAGLVRDGNHADYWQLFEPFPNRTKLRRLVLQSSLAVHRGHSLKYSDLGYALLGEVIAGASHTTYVSYIQKNIIDALGLTETFTDLSHAVKKRLATCYSGLIEKQRLILEPRPAAAFTSAAGLYMTASDDCTFLAGLFKGDERLLLEKSKHFLLQDRRRHWAPDRSEATEYGLGFMFADINGNTLTGHSGSFAGYSSAAFADIDNELVVSVAANAKDAPVLDMCFGTFEALYYFVEHASKPLELEAEHNNYNIRLRNLWQVVEIVATHDRTVAVDPDEWFPFSAGLRDLEVISNTKLKIKHDYDLLTPAEYIYLTRQNRRITSAVYAGVTMVPDREFVRWFKQR